MVSTNSINNSININGTDKTLKINEIKMSELMCRKLIAETIDASSLTTGSLNSSTTKT